MLVELDLQVSSPCPDMAHLAGGYAHSRSGDHAPASSGGADIVISWQQRLATTAHQRKCGIRLRGGECMIPGGGYRLVEFTTVVCGCMDRPVVHRALSQHGLVTWALGP